MSDEIEEVQPLKPQSKGGLARAVALSGKKRSAIAQQAAEARWGKSLPKAKYGSPDRPIRLGTTELQCYVLDDDAETRVLTQADFLQALGRHRKANVRDEGAEERIPPILQGKALKPFISKELIEKSQPVKFRLPGGGSASGYRAEVLPMVCNAYLQANDALALPANQKHVAKQAEILVRALAHTGIIALVDEVTGYQQVRAKDALSRILEEYIAKELQPYIPTFGADYYQEMFRLRGLDYPKDTVKRPQYFGILTNDIIYRRLAPGVLDELRAITPRLSSGRLSTHLFRRLTQTRGYPKLKEHYGAVVTMMQLSADWHDFMKKLNRLRPRFDLPKGAASKQLSFDYDAAADNGEGL